MFSKKSLLQHLVAIVIIILVNVVYFYPQLQGKVLRQGDIVSSSQASKALQEYQNQNDKTYLWNPAQFGGMPVLAGPPSRNNIVFKAYKVLQVGFGEPIGMFIAGTLMAYLMLILLGVNSWLSIFLSLAMALATSNVILWEAGHNSKIRTLIFTPLLIAGILSIFEYKKYFLGFILVAFGFAFSFYTRHPQMTYYILLVFLVYGIIVLIDTIKNKDWIHFAKATLLVIGAIALGASTSATKLWSLYDYSKVTMRGDSILESENTNSASSSEVDGLAWDYAMQWSNDGKDLMATFIPGFVGGGDGQKISKNSKTFQTYNLTHAPMYWGQLPPTVGPMYVGGSIVFFFVLGLLLVKGRIKWWLGIGALWMSFLSMGKNFEILNQFVFDFFPLYSKFRVPQSVLCVAPFFLVVLAALGANKFLTTNFNSKKYKKRNREKYTKALLTGFAICGGLALLTAVIGPSLFEFTRDSDARYTQQGVDLSIFIADRKAMMRGDGFRVFILIAIIAAILYAHIIGKISRTVTAILVGLVALIDMVGVDWRYLDHGKFIPKRTYNESFVERPVDNQIKSLEKDRAAYRVHDVSINTFNSSQASAAHNTIGGYDPAKMQRAQDLIERHISQNNMQVLNMMNTKYFIVPGQNQQPTVQSNPGALGTAWYVGNIHRVNNANEEINALSSINTSNTAVIHAAEFGSYIEGLSPGIDSSASIAMTAYEPDKITYSSSSNKEMLTVFSEMWYGPNKGWQAYLDGNKVDHIRANYALRAMRVPAGNHEIIFEFRPQPYYMGEKISLIGSILMILLVIGYLYWLYKENKGREVLES